MNLFIYLLILLLIRNDTLKINNWKYKIINIVNKMNIYNNTDKYDNLLYIYQLLI